MFSLGKLKLVLTPSDLQDNFYKIMKKYISKHTILISSLLLPVATFAAPLEGLSGLLRAFRGLLNLIVPVIFGLALVYFFWGLTQFILHDAGSDKTREEGKKKIIWGIVALFVFISIYGILGMIGKLIDIPIKSGASSNSLPSEVGEDI